MENKQTMIRGIMEEKIDDLIQPESLNRIIKIFQKTFPIGHTEDFIFGFIVGNVLSGAAILIQISYGRYPSLPETIKFVRILENNTLKIKGAIKVALGK